MLELNESKPIEDLLEKTRLNCVYRENLHRKNYHFWKSKEKYFEIPLIVLSAINSIVAVGLTAYMSQKNVSAVNCLLSLCCGVISSLQLYLNISEMMELNATMSKEFYTLSISIYKYLHLPKKAREINEKDYLNKVYSQYTKLCENSQLLKQRFKNDHLVFDANSESNDFNSESSNELESPVKDDNNV